MEIQKATHYNKKLLRSRI